VAEPEAEDDEDPLELGLSFCGAVTGNWRPPPDPPRATNCGGLIESLLAGGLRDGSDIISPKKR